MNGAGKLNYSAMLPKCGTHYRSGRWVKTGTKPKEARGSALSASSGTEMQNVYEAEGGKIHLYRKLAKGTTGLHVSINPECVMFGVLPSHPTDSAQ